MCVECVGVVGNILGVSELTSYVRVAEYISTVQCREIYAETCREIIEVVSVRSSMFLLKQLLLINCLCYKLNLLLQNNLCSN